MGLTIHWDLRYKGTREEVVSKLARVGEIAKELGFKNVGKLWQLDYSKDFNNDDENLHKGGLEQDDYRWAKIQCQPDSSQSQKFFGYVISCWAGKGCEPTNIGLVSQDGEIWLGHSFTKTQYAEEFVKCHLLVINLLKACKKLGILRSVSDEGEYWGKEDISVLADNINESTIMIDSFAKVLTNSFGSNVVESPIDSSKNIVIVKKKNGKSANRLTI